MSSIVTVRSSDLNFNLYLEQNTFVEKSGQL